MARECSICIHPERERIDQMIVSGASNRSIAVQFSVNHNAVQRHRTNHLPKHLSTAKEAEMVSQADDLLSQMDRALQLSWTITDNCTRDGDNRTALAGLKEVRECLKVLLEVSGKLQAQSQVNIILNPQFQKLQMILLRELEEYPTIRQRIVTALQEVA